MKIRAYDIDYDTDGHEVSLPSELVFEVDSLEEIADKISDATGWVVYTFKFEIL